MPKVTVYHNPGCSKSRQAVRLLEERGADLKIVDYLEVPPNVDELEALCRALDVEPLAIFRTKERRFAELGLTIDDDRPRAEWLRLLAENPILIERPILCHEGRCVVGRPPERALEIL